MIALQLFMLLPALPIVGALYLDYRDSRGRHRRARRFL